MKRIGNDVEPSFLWAFSGQRVAVRLAMVIAALALFFVSPVGARGFAAIEVSDAEGMADWYARTFGLSEIKRIEIETVKVIILDGDHMIVELIQRAEPLERADTRHRGLAKVGAVISDFDAAIAKWRREEVVFFGDRQDFYDAEMDRRTTILLDPEGNRVQVFSHPCGGDAAALTCR